MRDEGKFAEIQSAKRLLLDYEIRGAWWPHYVSNRRLQSLVASYFVWKVNRKLRHVAESYAMKIRLEAARAELQKHGGDILRQPHERIVS